MSTYNKIQVSRNIDGNIITFGNTPIEEKPNACLSGEVNNTNPDGVNVINDIRTAGAGEKVYEMFNVPYTEFVDDNGDPFADAQACADFITLVANVHSGPTLAAGYNGVYNASTGLPDLSGGAYNNGDWVLVVEAGTVTIDAQTFTLEVNDQLKWDDTNNRWDHIPNVSASINNINQSAITQYDIHVDPDYTGAARSGSALQPYTNLATAIANSNAGESILIKGEIVVANSASDAFVLPHSLEFYGTSDAVVRFDTYNASNGDLFHFSGTDNTQKFIFDNLTIKNAGGYGIFTDKTARTEIRDCTFTNNGWSGAGLNTVLPSATSGVLGYDSSAAELQSFYAGAEASNGGAMRIQEATNVFVSNNLVTKNLRGIRVQDCGIGGGGFITRNQSHQNIESGIYLASGAMLGCQNVVVAINSSAYNSNNGLLCIGGINNKFSQNEVNGNWNAGACGWGSANLTIRDCGLYDNNRSQFNGIGNTGDAKASIQINDAYDLLGTVISSNPAARFIAEVLDTQVHYTGLGSNTDRIGFFVGEEVGDLPADQKNIIKVDDVGFIGQDFAFDFSEVDASNLQIVLGDNSYINLGQTAVKPPVNGDYYELPFGNHTTDLQEVDVKVDVTGSVIIKEGPFGVRLNPYKVNDLAAEVHGSKIKVLLKESNKIQFTVPVSGLSFDGTAANSILGQAVTQLNDVLTNTVGYATDDNHVTSFNLSGNDLTLGLNDGSSYTVDVTTLLVDENKFVTSGALNGTDLELTMSDASVVTINAANMVNGSGLPARSQDWYIAYGSRSGEQIVTAGIVLDVENHQPFYNGSFLKKGEEYIWTHDTGGSYILGIWGISTDRVDDVDVFGSNKWELNFRFPSQTDGSSEVSELSNGVDVASRYATGYAITNNTVFALRYGYDNYLTLIDITNGGETIIGRSNTPLVGEEATIFFGGSNQPNAKFPIMVKRKSQWTIVHDFDNSENGEWIDGLESNSVVSSNIEFGPGEKMLMNFNYFGRNEKFGFNYNGDATNVTNAHEFIEDFLAYGAAEQIVQSGTDWNWNTDAQYYNAAGPRYERGQNLGLISFRYLQDNSIELWSEEVGERIATKASPADGSNLRVSVGFSEAHASARIPAISKQSLTQGSQPTVNFLPAVSAQTFQITKGQVFSVTIAKDAGSAIVNQFGETDAPSWAVLDGATGVLTGTAPSDTGTHVVNMKAGNVLGGVVNFQVTLEVIEPVYTNTKSLLFRDGVNSYLGGNAALVSALERSGNGSGSSEAWTIAFLYKGGSSNQGQTLFYYGANDIVNNGHIEIKQTNHNGLKRLRFRFGTNVNHLQLTTPSGSIDPTKWQHVLVSYNGGTTGVSSGNVSDYYQRFKIFIDNVEQSTSNTHSNNGYSGGIVGENFRFGRLVSGNYPRGAILNQLAIWNSDQSSNVAGLYNGGESQDISLLQPGFGNMNTNYLPPDHYYEIEDSVSLVEDLIGSAHLVGYNFASSDLVTDAP